MKATNEAIREVLATVGPMTSAEIHAFFPDSTIRDVSSALGNMRIALAVKRVYICEWTKESVYGGKLYPRPVYALGAKPDARKPKNLTNAEKLRRSRAKNKIPKINSVWALAGVVGQ
jgi:hypothetical protein